MQSETLEQEVWLPPLPYQRAVAPELERLRRIVTEVGRDELLEAVMPSVLNARFA